MNQRLIEMLTEAVNGTPSPAKPRPLHEAQIAELRAVFACYGRCPFRPGDLVTPRRNSNVTQDGEPHLVLEIAASTEPDWRPQVGTGEHGARWDMRVGAICEDGATIHAHWVESFAFVPYVAPEGPAT